MPKGVNQMPETTMSKLQADAIVASVNLKEAERRLEEGQRHEEDLKAENDKGVQASLDFSQAYFEWLTARAGLQDTNIPEDEQPARFKAQIDAERRLFSTPATCAEQLWDKLTAFETILGEELTIGLRKESVLLLALGSIKQDIVSLDFLEGGR
jgi:hypothetical protein